MSDQKHAVVPTPNGSSMEDARKWFAQLHDGGLHGFHADDVAIGNYSHLFTPEAERKFCETLTMFRTASTNWSDPDFIYDLAGEGRFAVEQAYPELIVDVSIPMAGRSGYTPIPNQAKPTIIVEECNEFAAIEIHTPTGNLSDTDVFYVIPVENARFEDGEIDVSEVALLREDAIPAYSLDEVAIIVEAHTSAKARPRF